MLDGNVGTGDAANPESRSAGIRNLTAMTHIDGLGGQPGYFTVK